MIRRGLEAWRLWEKRGDRGRRRGTGCGTLKGVGWGEGAEADAMWVEEAREETQA